MYNPVKPYKHDILTLIESTWDTPYVRVERGLYPIFKKKFSSWEVHHTDGIGTKGWYHWKKRTFANAVVDALAMNLNDLAMVGATPYAIQNHIVLPKDDHNAILSIVKKLAAECTKRNIAMTGGETSIHSDVIGMDLSITVSAFLKKRFKNQCKVGDVLIGLPSSGIHSNGITKVRELFGNSYKGAFTEPTTIYFDSVLEALHTHRIHGMMHITGGAFSKLKDILKDADAVIEKFPHVPRIFYDIYAKRVSNKTMYATFNCGVGFVLSVPKSEVVSILSHFKKSAVIGRVEEGTGMVRIVSAFDGGTVVL